MAMNIVGGQRLASRNSVGFTKVTSDAAGSPPGQRSE